MREFDASVPNVARMYDYALCGKDNFAADRDAADAILETAPDAFRIAHDNRRFLRRAVEYVARRGVAQFIDIGSGLPTAENTHEVAQGVNGLSRVAYVDRDPVVVNHAAALLAGDGAVIAMAGDLREPRRILADPALGELIDLGKPVAVVLVAVLHFLPDPLAHDVVGYLRQAMPEGSYLVISHATADCARREEVQVVSDVYRRASSPITLRTAGEVGRFFSGLELAGPGVADINAWRGRAGRMPRTACYGGVARKGRASLGR